MSGNSVEILVAPNTNVEPIALITWLEQNPDLPISGYPPLQQPSPQAFFDGLSAENYAEYLIVKHAQNKKQFIKGGGISQLHLEMPQRDIKCTGEKNVIFHGTVAQELLKKGRLDIALDLFYHTAEFLDCPWIINTLDAAYGPGNPIDFSKEPLLGETLAKYEWNLLLTLIRNRAVKSLEGFLPGNKSKIISTLLNGNAQDVDLALTFAVKEPNLFGATISSKIDEAIWDASPGDVYRFLDIAYRNSDHNQNPFSHILSPQRLNPAKPIINFKIFYDALFERYPDWFQETQFINQYVNWIRSGYPIQDILNIWPLDDQLFLLTKILQNLSAHPYVCDLNTVSKWKDSFSKNFDNQTMPTHIERLFWQTMYAADSGYRGKTGPQPCSDLRFHILTQHRETLVENDTQDYHLVIIQYIKDKLIPRHSLAWLGRFLRDETIPVQYRYFALTEQHAKDPRALFAFFDDLPTSERAGFTASKPYKIAQCQTKIMHSIAQLQTAIHRLSTEERRHFAQACSTFSQGFQRYQNNEIDHTALFESFTTTFNAEALQPILATHSQWYRLLLDIAMNILVIGSIVGLVALTAYRAYQGFQHGFFMHTQTNRQRMQKELEDTVRSLPEGRVFSF